jgi:ankyrin repeat protein
MFRSKSGPTDPRISSFLEKAQLGLVEDLERELQENPSIINSTDGRNETALIEAARNNQPAAIKCLLIHGADTEIQSDSGHAAIHWAVRVGSLEIVKLLVRKNPELINQKGPQNWTPFHFSVEGSYAAIVEFLIARGADVNAIATTNDGREFKGVDIASTKEIRDMINSQITPSGNISAFSVASLQEEESQKQAGQKSAVGRY